MADDDTLTQRVFISTEKNANMTIHTNMIYKRLPKLIASNNF